MNKTIKFDVLVVYTNAIAKSASSNKNILSPFHHSKNREHYNNAYAYFLEYCNKSGLSAAFTTAKDIRGSGTVANYWTYENNNWIKNNNVCYSNLIFDKLSPFGSKQTKIIELLFSGGTVKPFNGRELFKLFFDKQETYDQLQDFIIPTVKVEGVDKQSVIDALVKINDLTAKHVNANDFSKKIIVKDRFGSGGNDVFLVDEVNTVDDIYSIVNSHKGTSFILQPFAQFETGYMHKQKKGFVDIRLIFLGQKIIQAYIRQAKDNDFRCNEHQGGQLHYLAIREVPKKVRDFSYSVVEVLDTKHDLFALDLVVSNNGNVYLMEGNIRPGLDWNLALKKNEKMAKKLIRIIVKELTRRVNINRAEKVTNIDDLVMLEHSF